MTKEAIGTSLPGKASIPFCTCCGKQMVENKKEISYDENTGQEIQHFVWECMNESCLDGCFNTGGHDWDQSIRKMWKGTVRCKKCDSEPKTGGGIA